MVNCSSLPEPAASSRDCGSSPPTSMQGTPATARPSTDLPPGITYKDLREQIGFPYWWKVISPEQCAAAERAGYNKEQVEQLRRAWARDIGRRKGEHAGAAAAPVAQATGNLVGQAAKDAVYTFTHPWDTPEWRFFQEVEKQNDPSRCYH